MTGLEKNSLIMTCIYFPTEDFEESAVKRNVFFDLLWGLGVVHHSCSCNHEASFAPLPWEPATNIFESPSRFLQQLETPYLSQLSIFGLKELVESRPIQSLLILTDNPNAILSKLFEGQFGFELEVVFQDKVLNLAVISEDSTFSSLYFQENLS